MKKRVFYWIEGKVFPTFAEAKRWGYFNMKDKEFKIMEEVTIMDGEITKEYKITKTERRIIICKIKDYLKERIRNYELKQLKLFN